MNGDQGIVAAIGVAIGGILTEFARWALRRGERTVSLADQIRDELRQDLLQLKDEISQVHHELDEWKQRYYSLQEENLELRKRCICLENELRLIQMKLGCNAFPSLPDSDSPSI